MSSPHRRHRSDADEVAALWSRHRRRVTDVAYRIMGSVADADEATAEAFARLLEADLDAIEDPEGWLISVTGRLCIDRLRSAEHRRRAYPGPWLPEPLVRMAAEPAAVRSLDPADRVTLDESVRMALLVVLEQLSPAERTSFVLHDLFGVPYDEVGAIVGRSPAACRQLASRARRHIRSRADEPRSTACPDELEAVAERFASACRGGSLDDLLDVLDPEVVGNFDSGGAVPGAPLDSVSGATRVARVLHRAFVGEGLEFRVDDVNGEPGVVVMEGGRVAAVIWIGVRDERVARLHGVGNPAKLRHLRTGDDHP